MKNLFVLLSFLVAEEIIQLEPVQANNFECNTAATSSATQCYLNPYCHWNTSASGANKCTDDPCLKKQDAGVTVCDDAEGVSCSVQTVATDSDCVTGGTGTFCRATASTAAYDYCFWASLRDDGGANACPSSVCKYEGKKCVSRTGTSGCQFLDGETDCKLVPKCMWLNSRCEQDPCFYGSEGQSCATWTNSGATWTGGALVSGDCVRYEPYKPDGTVASYCLYKDNKNPNVCYFLGSNYSSNPTDYGNAYPTYVAGGANPKKPSCTAAISACDNNPSGMCTTKWNSKGALAGQYCGDAAHGDNAAANILRIPSLVVFLLSSIFVSLFAL